jgi:cell fate (sporulation/competence/biofilm development) regulator YmcA (YheA/YmcA/DUF963 family)
MIRTRERGTDMCEKCAELDERIERYRRVSSSINDQLTIDRIKELIEELQLQKAALHPERE